MVTKVTGRNSQAGETRTAGHVSGLAFVRVLLMEHLRKAGDAQLMAAGGKSGRIASNEMCTFLILNISSLQLIPVNMIAYRQQYGSANPAGIIAPAIVAPAVSTGVAIVYCKAKDWKRGA